MKHLDQRIYAGTALVAALAGAAVLFVTQPVAVSVIEAANARPRTSAALVTWKGVQNVVMHESTGETVTRTAAR